MLSTELEVRPHRSAFVTEWAALPDTKASDGPSVSPLSPPDAPGPASEFQAEPQYSTQWRGRATLEEILADKNVRNVAFAKMRSLGHIDQDAEDCFQLGSINFWKVLKDQPTILTDKRAAWVGVWIALSGSRRGLWKHRARCVSLDDPDRRIGRPERWAGFATRIDEQIDFVLLMNTLAQRYDGDLLKLYAMYSLTTSVAMKDALSLAGVTKDQMIDAQNAVKADIRALLELDPSDEVAQKYWKGQLEKGEGLDCVTRVAEEVLDNQRLLLALYIVTTSATRKDVIALFGIGRTAFRKEVTQIKAMLSKEFRNSERNSRMSM